MTPQTKTCTECKVEFDGESITGVVPCSRHASAEALYEATKAAKELIRLNADLDERGWHIFQENSPGMRQINAAIKQYEGGVNL